MTELLFLLLLARDWRLEIHLYGGMHQFDSMGYYVGVNYEYLGKYEL